MSSGKRSDDTKKFKPEKESKKTGKNKSKNNDNGKKSKVKKVVKILIIILFLLLIVFSGVVVGAFYGMFGDELTISKEELVIPYENSTVYDKDGNLSATLSGGTKRKCITLSQMGDYLPKAYVAIEDERFYEHKGVDIKRTGAATLTYVIHRGKSSFGGSTITQQLVKNITNDKEDSNFAGIIRKVKEMSKAMQVEQYLSKDQILELYLNMIFIGGNDINGVELGSIYYFNKEPAELSIAQCAYMAGINHMPNSYKPFDEDPDGKNKEAISKRTKTVLGKMLELGYINQEQYDSAVAEVDTGLAFVNGDTSPTTEISYTVEAALKQIMKQIVDEKQWSESYAETYLYSGGLKIYTTQDTAIQTTLEDVIKQDKYCTETTIKDKEGNKHKQNSMPTMVIIDHTTGNVVASTSATGEKGARNTTTRIGYLNIPTKVRKSTGSSMKPLSVIAPGLESKTISAATVYNDAQTTFGKKYTPKNYYAGFKGLMTMRHAIEISANIPHVKALSDIGTETAVDFCERIGLPRFEKEGLSLALGGLSDGVTVTEMAGAYSAIANNGNYIEPTFYKYVTDKDDNVVIEPNQKIEQVMSEQNAYITKSILTEPVVGGEGTATYCKINGIDTAAKTGTTNDDYDRWLCGFTPYYTAVCWYGYETNSPVVYSGNPAGKIWAEVMSSIHKDLPNATFTRPGGIVEVAVCKTTGLRATNSCSNKYTEIFAEDAVPEACDGHSAVRICSQTGLKASDTCPFAESKFFGGIPPKERNASWSSNKGASSAPGDVCPHTAADAQEPEPEDSNTNTTPNASTNTTSPAQTPTNTTNTPTTNTVTNTTTPTPPSEPPPSTNTTPEVPTVPPTNTTTDPPASSEETE